MSVVKIIGVAAVGLCAVLTVKGIMPSMAVFVSVSCSVIILGICMSEMKGFIGYYYDLCRDSGYGEYFSVMLKGLGVALLTQMGSELCRDSGEELLASRIEFAGKIEILLISLPLVKSLIALSRNILMS